MMKIFITSPQYPAGMIFSVFLEPFADQLASDELNPYTDLDVGMYIFIPTNSIVSLLILYHSELKYWPLHKKKIVLCRGCSDYMSAPFSATNIAIYRIWNRKIYRNV